MQRAVCHESAHAIVALALGFHVVRIEISRGLPRFICELDLPAKSLMQRCVVLAAGIAGELLFFPTYDHEACAQDQEMIFERGGQSIEKYVPDAQSIMSTNADLLAQLKKKLTYAWMEGEALVHLGSHANSFILMSEQEIKDFWPK